MEEQERPTTFDESDESFNHFMKAIQDGDVEARERASLQVLPQVMAALQQSFKSERHLDRDAAVNSAFRTLIRRGWRVEKDVEGEKQVIAPSTWEDLAGLCIRFAKNKLRTQRKRRDRRKMRTLPANVGDDGRTGESRDVGADVFIDVIRREAVGAVQTAVNALELRDQVICRCKMDELTYMGIKAALKEHGINVSEKTIARRWSVIKQQLARVLSDYQEE